MKPWLLILPLVGAAGVVLWASRSGKPPAPARQPARAPAQQPVQSPATQVATQLGYNAGSPDPLGLTPEPPPVVSNWTPGTPLPSTVNLPRTGTPCMSLYGGQQGQPWLGMRAVARERGECVGDIAW